MRNSTNLNLKLPEGSDFISIEDLNDNSEILDNEIAILKNFGTATGTNTYVLANTNITTLVAGLRLIVKFTNANTGAATLNVNSLGAKSIVKPGGGALGTGSLKANGVYALVYDGTSFQLQGEGGDYGTVTAADVLSGVMFGTSNGLFPGTMPNNGTYNKTIGVNSSTTIPKGYHNGQGMIGNSTPGQQAKTWTPSTVDQTIAAGRYLVGDQIIKGDINLISANIKAGVPIFGVVGNPNVVDTSEGDATASQIMSGKKAFVDGELLTGTMPSKAAETITPGTTNKTIAAGQYLSGIQTIAGDANLIGPNILSGKSIFGEAGTAPNVTESTAAPTGGLDGDYWIQT